MKKRTEFEKCKKRSIFWGLAFPILCGCFVGGLMTLFFYCQKDEPHWSHKECVEKISERLHLTDYVYSVEEVENKYIHGDDEVYTFEITVRAEGMEWQYYCCAVIGDGEVVYVDCDYIGVRWNNE